MSWFASKLPRFLARWYWSEKRIREGISFDIRSRHDPISIWLHECAKIEIWFEVSNSNVLDVTIDRIILHYDTDKGASADFYYLKRIVLSGKSDTQDLLVSARISETERQQFISACEGSTGRDHHRIEYHLEIDSRFRSFSMSGKLEGVTPRIMNLPSNIHESKGTRLREMV